MSVYQYYKQKSKVPSIPEIDMPEHIIKINISVSEAFPEDSSQSRGNEDEDAEGKDEITRVV